MLPSSDWIIYDSYKDFERKPRIFLNYQKKPSLKFNNLNENFVSEGHVQYTNFLESITFKTKRGNFFLDDKIKIYKIINGKKKLVFERYINENIVDQKKIYTNFKKVFNSRWEQFHLELNNVNNNNKIKEVVLNFKNKYQFNDEDILFSKKIVFLLNDRNYTNFFQIIFIVFLINLCMPNIKINSTLTSSLTNFNI